MHKESALLGESVRVRLAGVGDDNVMDTWELRAEG